MALTSHGHHIPGTSSDDESYKRVRARCGGPGLCPQCSKEAIDKLPDGSSVPKWASKADPPFEDTSDYDKDPNRFLRYAKQYVVGAHAVVTAESGEDELTVEQLYIVWWTYILGNWKAMISTTVPGDGLYFEVTHDVTRHQTYVDTYKKTANQVFDHNAI